METKMKSQLESLNMNGEDSEINFWRLRLTKRGISYGQRVFISDLRLTFEVISSRSWG